jgi:hypothetical protein
LLTLSHPSLNPHQIGQFKIEKHQAFIRDWLKQQSKVTFDLIWKAREQWIKKLSENEIL